MRNGGEGEEGEEGATWQRRKVGAKEAQKVCMSTEAMLKTVPIISSCSKKCPLNSMAWEGRQAQGGTREWWSELLPHLAPTSPFPSAHSLPLSHRLHNVSGTRCARMGQCCPYLQQGVQEGVAHTGAEEGHRVEAVRLLQRLQRAQVVTEQTRRQV